MHTGAAAWSLRPRAAGLGYGLGPAAALILGAAYLLWTPAVPDLAAQVARADTARIAGMTTWWTGWFGGVSLPTYSMFVPAWMAVFGVEMTGLLAVVAGTAATARLVRDARRPRAGAVACVVAQAGDLLDGRVTFAVGVALGAWSLVALRQRHALLCLAAAVACFGASPLAGLFLGIVLLATAAADRSRRRTSVAGAVVLVGVGTTMAFLFPGTGTMPFHAGDVIAPGAACLGVLMTCRTRVLRVAALLLLAAIVAFFLHPGAVGQNVTRLAWIAAAPVVIAYSALPSKRTVAIAAGLALWPAGDLIGQLHTSTAKSSQESFYRPVATHVSRLRAAAGPSAIGRRLEVVDTANHWGSAYLSSQSLARGWDRQVDRAVNPIFYRPGALTAASYRTWLDHLAVGWVALPSGGLDYASADEGALVRSGLPYLSLVWSSHDWRLYRVRAPTNLVTGARLVSVGANSLVVRTTRPGFVGIRVRWSAYLQVDDSATGAATPGCVLDAGGWVRVYLPRPQTFRLTTDFDPATRLRGTDTDCPSDVPAD